TYGGGISDGFVTKVTPGNTKFTYSTYLGGAGQDLCTRVAVDGSGNAYVVGGTSSSDFPVTPAAFQTQNAGSQDAFIAMLTIAGSPTTITTVTPNPSVPGQSVTVGFTVTPVPPASGTPTGNVTVSDGVDSCVATVAQGSCSLVFPTWGTYFLTASYAG